MNGCILKKSFKTGIRALESASDLSSSGIYTGCGVSQTPKGIKDGKEIVTGKHIQQFCIL